MPRRRRRSFRRNLFDEKRSSDNKKEISFCYPDKVLIGWWQRRAKFSFKKISFPFLPKMFMKINLLLIFLPPFLILFAGNKNLNSNFSHIKRYFHTFQFVLGFGFLPGAASKVMLRKAMRRNLTTGSVEKLSGHYTSSFISSPTAELAHTPSLFSSKLINRKDLLKKL